MGPVTRTTATGRIQKKTPTRPRRSLAATPKAPTPSPVTPEFEAQVESGETDPTNVLEGLGKPLPRLRIVLPPYQPYCSGQQVEAGTWSQLANAAPAYATTSKMALKGSAFNGYLARKNASAVNKALARREEVLRAIYEDKIAELEHENAVLKNWWMIRLEDGTEMWEVGVGERKLRRREEEHWRQMRVAASADFYRKQVAAWVRKEEYYVRGKRLFDAN